MPHALPDWRRGLHLLRWLGPWAGLRAPGGVNRTTLEIPALSAGERPFGAWLYVPTACAVAGSVIVAPGLNPLGAADARLVRLATVLASAGIVVCTPFVPDSLLLQVTEAAIADFQRAVAVFLGRPELPAGRRPGVVSVSFGSLLALRAIAAPALRERVGGAFVFGGYADLDEAVRFALSAAPAGTPTDGHDPLNRPLVYMNLVAHIPGAPEDCTALQEAWLRYVRTTWSDEQYKHNGAHVDVAHAIAVAVPPAQRELFLRGVGAIACDDHSLIHAALARRGAYFDPRPFLAGVRCPVHLVHATADCVIPVSQLDLLARALPAGLPVTVYCTNLFGHAGPRPGFVGAVASLGGELAIARRIMHGLLLASADEFRPGP